VRFWAFLGKGSTKTRFLKQCKKSMSKTFSEKIDKIFGVSFSSTFLLLSRSQVLLSDGSLKILSKILPKTFYKSSVSKSFYLKIDQKIQNQCFLDFVYNHVLGRFSVRAAQKYTKKITRNKTRGTLEKEKKKRRTDLPTFF
jgi:hypothetical protein